LRDHGERPVIRELRQDVDVDRGFFFVGNGKRVQDFRDRTCADFRELLKRFLRVGIQWVTDPTDLRDQAFSSQIGKKTHRLVSYPSL
jgi:hypothetical protein